jgi:sugar phosphate isomerase/epimerase
LIYKKAESKTYADELKGKIASYGLEITELSTHLQGQWLPFILLMMTLKT